jgi:CBS domain-containing protein
MWNLVSTKKLEAMKKRTPVTEIMTDKVVTINHDDDLVVAELLFKSHNIRHIPVVHGDNVVGILSYTDLLRISFVDAVNEKDNEVDTVVYNMFTIEQVMAKNVVSVTPTTTIKEVAEILSEREFHALLVLEGQQLHGIVTTTDLIKYLLAQY